MSWTAIMVPYDFSSSADHALATARDEAKVHRAKLVVVHVVELTPNLKPDTVIVTDDSGAPMNIKDYAVSQAEAQLGVIAAELARDGAPASTHIRIGNAADEINRFVEDNDIDLVVMGTTGRTGLAHVVIGSVAERVVRTSKVPVLTLRAPAA